MSLKHNEIEEDEIRVISSEGGADEQRRRRPLLPAILTGVLIVLTVLAVIFLMPSDADDEAETGWQELPRQEEIIPSAIVRAEPPKAVIAEKAFTRVVDTLVNGRELLILFPENAKPSLHIGDVKNIDSCAVLALQAADVRRDNGQIAGTYVLNGELISKGEAKAGFCSIVNGELTIGVADATPMFEQALSAGGSFFRQYPLVVGGQIVENKPKGKAVRKALAEIDGKICVVISKNRLTFHDFSQLLTDAGVRNAIYLVGGDSAGFYVTGDKEKFNLSRTSDKAYENVNFIVWR